MNRAAFILVFVLVQLTTLCSAEKPDILFLIADDQCFETVGALGLTDIDTPHLDRLCRGGVTFTHAYNMGSWSGAVCVASRHMLNTGAFLWKAEQISRQLGGPTRRTEAQDSPWPNFAREGLMWSQLMKAAGYDTYFTGKWHVRAAADQVFDVARHVRPGMPNQTPEGYNRPVEGRPDPWDPADRSFGGFWEGGTHWSEIAADDARQFLDTAASRDTPFFMYVSFNAPHDPRQSPQHYLDRYPLDRIALPENFLPEYPHKDKIGNSPDLRDERLAPFPRTEHAVRVNRREYYAIITHMDEQIGRILDRLESSGRADNTFVFFTSDHGLAVGRHGLMGKQNMFDHSLRVPLMVTGPGIEPGSTVSEKVYLQDVMTTCLELGGAEIPEHVQFRSLRPVWSGEAPGYGSIYGAYLENQRCVIRGDHKLILYPEVPAVLLFDIAADPFEMRDIAPSHPERVQSLFGELLAWQEATGDTLDLAAAFPALSAPPGKE